MTILPQVPVTQKDDTIQWWCENSVQEMDIINIHFIDQPNYLIVAKEKHQAAHTNFDRLICEIYEGEK